VIAAFSHIKGLFKAKIKRLCNIVSNASSCGQKGVGDDPNFLVASYSSMDGYPAHAVTHNLPFVILFGLGSAPSNLLEDIEAHYPLLHEKGIYISSDLPSVTGPTAEELLKCFRDFDAKDAAWNSRPGKGKLGAVGFTYRSVGRVGQTPLPFAFLFNL
jgi:hypothetical protein